MFLRCIHHRHFKRKRKRLYRWMKSRGRSLPKHVQRPMQNNSRKYCQTSFMNHTEFPSIKKQKERRVSEDMFSLLRFPKLHQMRSVQNQRSAISRYNTYVRRDEAIVAQSYHRISFNKETHILKYVLFLSDNDHTTCHQSFPSINVTQR